MLSSLVNYVKFGIYASDVVTPKEQLDRLQKAYTNEIEKGAGLITVVTKIIYDYYVDDECLGCMTNWYKALDRIKALPERLPALPKNIHEIFEGPCPIYGKVKRVCDTHFLMLLPKNLGSLMQFIQRVDEYGEQLFSHFEPDWIKDWIMEYHGDIAERTYWVLMSKEILPESRSMPVLELKYGFSSQPFTDLCKKSGIDYRVPRLGEAIAAIFLHKMATGEELYHESDPKTNRPTRYTHVLLFDMPRFYLGSYGPSGFRVEGQRSTNASSGIAVVREL